MPKASSIDHLVLPVSDLIQARTRYEALGFNVAPDALHPFGTENCCVFLSDGTYLEPLGVADRMLAEKKASKNPFVRFNQAYQFRVAEEGFSMLAMQSKDARGDRKKFKKNGFQTEKLLEFSRKAKSEDGEEIKLSVKLAFVRDQRAPDTAIFACERHGMHSLWSEKRTMHANGVLGLSAIVASELNPTDFQYYLQTITGMRDFASSSSGMNFNLPGADIICYSPDAIKQIFGIDTPRTDRGLRFEAVIYKCRKLDDVEKHLTKNKISFTQHLNRIVVKPAAGQGVPFLFEEEVK